MLFRSGESPGSCRGHGQIAASNVNALFISLPVGQRDKYQEMVSTFPQVGSNTKMGLLQMESAAEDLLRTSGAPSGTANGARTYTFEQFIRVFAKDSRDAVEGLRELDKQCNVTISRDATALESMSVNSER